VMPPGRGGGTGGGRGHPSIMTVRSIAPDHRSGS
jgi:hypothetical protein